MFKINSTILLIVITEYGFITQFKIQIYRLVIQTKAISFRRDAL